MTTQTTHLSKHKSYLIQHDRQKNQHHIEIFTLAAPIPQKMQSKGALGTEFQLTDEKGLFKWLTRLRNQITFSTINGTWFSMKEPCASHRLIVHLMQAFQTTDPLSDPELLLLEDDALLTDAKFMFDWTIEDHMLVTRDGRLLPENITVCL